MRTLINRLRPATVKHRVLAIFIACGALVVLAASVYHGASQSASVEVQLRAGTEALAAHIATMTADNVAANNAGALSQQLDQFSSYTDVRELVIADRQGRGLAAMTRNAHGNLHAQPPRTAVPPPEGRATSGVV